VRLFGGDAEGVEVQPLSGGKMHVKWKQLTPKEIYGLSRGMLQDNDVEGYLTVARLAIALGCGDEMDKSLERLELNRPDAVGRIERVRSEIDDVVQAAKAAAAPKPAPAPIPTAVANPAPGVPEAPAEVIKPAMSGGKMVNHEGRPLPPLPKFTTPVLFNTPEADAIAAAMQIFPRTNPWNQDISKHKVHPDSAAIIASIGAEKHIGINDDMAYVFVPPNQKRVDVKIAPYSGESDKGPYPVPDNAPIEGWPLHGGTLDEAQRKGDGDRHVIVVDPHAGMLYEFFVGRKTDSGWQAACEATFNLNSNKTRPKGWTSSDAAGLPIFPAIIRYDECERGMVEHAMRFTVRQTRKAYIWPATHYASRNTSPTVPAMGQRLRLKADVDISKFPKHAKAVALGLKKYGMFVADNGSDWRMSCAPDKRIQGLRSLYQLKGSDFEVIETTPEDQVPGAK
jgi:hypothetical protein